MKIFIIGTGVMGGAIAKVLAGKKYKVFVYDINSANAKKLAKFGVVFDKTLENLSGADFVLLAVKPYHIAELNITNKILPKQILISIAAGVKISKLQKIFTSKKVVRVMPNLGLSIGQGMAVWKSSGLNSLEKTKVKKLITDFTENFEVKNEKDIDAVTAISGSGPAYFFLLAWCLEQSAKKLGLNPVQARKLVEKTFIGAAGLQNGKTYEELIKAVMSKKGTTEAAFGVFKKAGFYTIVNKAVETAFNRAKEISNE